MGNLPKRKDPRPYISSKLKQLTPENYVYVTISGKRYRAYSPDNESFLDYRGLHLVYHQNRYKVVELTDNSGIRAVDGSIDYRYRINVKNIKAILEVPGIQMKTNKNLEIFVQFVSQPPAPLIVKLNNEFFCNAYFEDYTPDNAKYITLMDIYPDMESDVGTYEEWEIVISLEDAKRINKIIGNKND